MTSTEPATTADRPRGPRPGLAALASAFLPGAGQLWAGRRRRGLILITIALAVTGWGIWLVVERPLTIATWSVQPTALRWLLVANGAALGFRVYAAVDAYLVAEGSGLGRTALFGVGGLLTLGTLTVLAVPHAVAGYYDVVEYDLITTVFRSAPVTIPPTTTPQTTTPPATLPPPASTLPPEPAAAVVTTPSLPPPTTTTSTTTTTMPIRIWDGIERLNVLLLGGDAGPGRTGVRTDTIILASIDPETGNMAMFSVPRNMARVPLPADLDIWNCDCFPGIINALWTFGTEHPERFSGTGPAGAEALKLAIGEMTGLPIHHYALVNLEGFVEIVDAMGGVDITVPTRVYDANYPHESGGREVIDIQPGEYHMEGHLALAYARSRHSSDDYSRMGRQRCVLEAVVSQADPITVIRSFPDIANAIKNTVSTDIPIERLPDLIALLPKLDAEEIVSVRFVPPAYTGPYTSEGYTTPDLEAIRNAVTIAVELPPSEAIERLGLGNGDGCGNETGPPPSP